MGVGVHVDVIDGDALADARNRQRAIVVARWAGVVFALVQVTTYDAAAYPDGSQSIAYGLVIALAVINGVTHVLSRRLGTETALHRLALAALGADVLLVSAVVWVYAFDPLSAIFVVLILLPIEGAMQLGLRGAMGTWGAVSLLYLVREWLGTLYGDPWEWTSVTFRVGVIGIVALIVGQLVRDLVEQREVTRLALTEARRADDGRARLVSILAHDVRAPLSAIRSGLALLGTAGDRLTEGQRSEIENAALRQTDRALLLARDLLDMARSESGALGVEPGDVELHPLVAEVGELASLSALLQIEVADGLRVYADRARLEQVLHNLLHNAGRYGAGPFIVTGTRIRGGVEIVVRDHGPGVPTDADLFAPFAGNGQGSVGLGIWTVRALTEAHGGTVDHQAADPGASFVVWLPDGPDTAALSASEPVARPAAALEAPAV